MGANGATPEPGGQEGTRAHGRVAGDELLPPQLLAAGDGYLWRCLQNSLPPSHAGAACHAQKVNPTGTLPTFALFLSGSEAGASRPVLPMGMEGAQRARPPLCLSCPCAQRWRCQGARRGVSFATCPPQSATFPSRGMGAHSKVVAG